MSVVERVRELVIPLLVQDGLELFDVEFSGGRLAVLVDRPGGIDMGALTDATHKISAVLDDADPVPGRYLLEVSSPGLERTLRTPEHYRRYVGSLVSVKTKPGTEGERRFKGVLSEAGDDGFSVDDRRLSYSDVERCHTVFEWGPTPRPGRAATPKTKGATGRRSGTAAVVRPDASPSADRHPTSDTKASAS
jgi:ribosome maturation factor RimP